HSADAQAGALPADRSPVAAGMSPVEADHDGYWTGFYLAALGIGVNEERYRQLFGAKPLPATWDDLLDTAYEGEIVITDPTASSTAYLFVQNQLQRLGWDEGWAYLERLAPLVGQFLPSGCAPPQLVGAGVLASCV